ncbi:hypothetical protein QQP08_022306 [Theobroma cacao]|nr:hypothetical protein QQP08_022306 [Theobroma cacao]
MRSGSRAANLEIQLYDFSEGQLIDNRNMVEKYQQSETVGNLSMATVEAGPPRGSSPPLTNQPKHKQSLLASEFPSENNAPNTEEAPQEQETPDVVELESPPGRDYQFQLDQMNANPDASGHRAVVRPDNSNPVHKRVEFVSSPGTTVESFLHANSTQNLMQPAYSGFEGSGSSRGDHATDAHQTETPPYSPLIMQPTHSFPLALAEKMPENGSYSAQSFYSEHEVNSVQANQLNGQIGSSSLTEQCLRPQRVEPLNRGKAVVADQFEQNIPNNYFNDNQQLPFSTLFPRSPSGIGFLNGGPTQFSQHLPSWLSSNENHLYTPLALLGSQVNQIKATNSSDPQCYNFMQPRTSAPLRPQQLNNPLQLLNQVPNMPNASDPLLQQSALTKHSMPMQLMPQLFPYQHTQFPMAPGPYNSQTPSYMLPESSMPLSSSSLAELRSPILPPYLQTNPLDVSDFQYRNSLQSKPVTLSSSYQLPAIQQASNQFSMMPSLPNLEHHNSELPENSLLPRAPTVQQQGLLTPTVRPIATYPSSGASLSSLVFNSLLQQDNAGASAPHQMETSLSSFNEQEILGRRGHARGRLELGESSSFKRFRRESVRPQASSAEPVNITSLSPQNEAAGPSAASFSHPRDDMSGLISEGL